MGWGEAHRPPPPTRADLVRDLAIALGESIPPWVPAKKAWPLLLERAAWAASYCVTEDMGSPVDWPPDPDAAPT